MTLNVTVSAAGLPQVSQTSIIRSAMRHPSPCGVSVAGMHCYGEADTREMARTKFCPSDTLSIVTTMNDRCKHDLERATCLDCTPLPAGTPRFVYVTEGGDKYHLDRQCKALASGQDEARSLGLKTHRIERVPFVEVVGMGRPMCAICDAFSVE